MATKKPNVKIENGKIIFSKEILDYYENLRTSENSEWIDKYFEILSSSSNITSMKFEKHHIIPCFVFKDSVNKTRDKTKVFADKIKENIIKLSIYNHIIAHYCLWKIFNNEDSRKPIYILCGNEDIKNIDELKIKEIAKIQEECAKENMTDEEKAMKNKIRRIKWYNEHKEEQKEYNKNYKQKNKDKLKKSQQKYAKENFDKFSKIKHDYRLKYHEKYLQYDKERYKNNRDKILKEKSEYRKNNPEKIKEIKAKSYIKNKDKILKKVKKYNSQLCYDPIKKDYPNLNTLRTRKGRHQELYENIIPIDCIIKPIQKKM